jgi:inner membrane protein
MDTGSHLLFGATLAGLAFFDPAVSAHPELAHAVLAATLLGSHAPDFDTLTRIKGYSNYIRHHRGITHSLPALFICPALISLLMGYLFGEMHQFAHLYFWSFIAVVFHVCLDLFNAYGVQSFRPFSQKWFHMDVLSLYEPFLFLIHVLGLVGWIFTSYSPSTIFGAVYAVTLVYILVRMFHHYLVVKRVKFELNQEGICHVIPDLHWFRWQFVLETDTFSYTGKVNYRDVTVHDVYQKDSDNEVVQASMGTDGVRAFLHFAQRVHVSFTVKKDGYEVKWRDLRFCHNRKLPFGVDVQLDQNLNVIEDKIGWNKKSWDPPYV